MDSIDRGFKEKDFSKNTINLLTASWRASTKKDYACKFRQIDPGSADLVKIASFCYI